MNKSFATVLFILLLAIATVSRSASKPLEITLGGTELSYFFTSKLLQEALKEEGYLVNFTYVGNIPTSRLEYMMSSGELSCYILGKTKSRTSKFLTINIGMTNNLFGKRILLIRPELQQYFNDVYSLDDFRKLQLISGMGVAWGEVSIWQHNNLPVQTIQGDWKSLYNMIASGNRNVDYLTRGAQEVLRDHNLHPELVIEKNLVLVTDLDHIMYVSPKRPELHKILTKALAKAKLSGLIEKIAKEFYPEVELPPISLSNRREIHLSIPN